MTRTRRPTTRSMSRSRLPPRSCSAPPAPRLHRCVRWARPWHRCPAIAHHSMVFMRTTMALDGADRKPVPRASARVTRLSEPSVPPGWSDESQIAGAGRMDCAPTSGRLVSLGGDGALATRGLAGNPANGGATWLAHTRGSSSPGTMDMPSGQPGGTASRRSGRSCRRTGCGCTASRCRSRTMCRSSSAHTGRAREATPCGSRSGTASRRSGKSSRSRACVS